MPFGLNPSIEYMCSQYNVRLGEYNKSKRLASFFCKLHMLQQKHSFLDKKRLLSVSVGIWCVCIFYCMWTIMFRVLLFYYWVISQCLYHSSSKNIKILCGEDDSKGHKVTRNMIIGAGCSRWFWSFTKCWSITWFELAIRM